MDERGESTLVLIEQLPWDMAQLGWSRHKKAELVSYIQDAVTRIPCLNKQSGTVWSWRHIIVGTLVELCTLFGLQSFYLPVGQLQEQAATLVDQDGFFEEVQRGLRPHHYVYGDEESESRGSSDRGERSVDSQLEVTTATGKNMWIPGIASDVLRLAVLCRETEQVGLLSSFLALGYLKGLVHASETSEDEFTDSDSSEIQDEDLVVCLLDDLYRHELTDLEYLVRSRNVSVDYLVGKCR